VQVVKNSTNSPPTKLITVSEAAEILAVSSSFVYLLIKRREIPSVSMGRAKRLRRKDIEDYIGANTSASSIENIDYNEY